MLPVPHYSNTILQRITVPYTVSKPRVMTE